ncbi:MAG TPA: AMP-binding protein, partial [Candidatus Baltobacteraceae bacterium]|nr:AMP-binding protein [Candidatus Baltobacteraceae bacterium]
MQAVEAARFEGPTPQAWSAGIRSEYERSATIDDLFAQRARERPSAIAATGDGFELTYSQLERDANRIANHLESLGVRAGAAVG